MIIYNITCKVHWSIQEEWMNWQKMQQIPAVLATGLFDDARFFRLLDQEDEEGPTFVLQYVTSSAERYEQYLIQFSSLHQEAARNKWGDQFIAFRTLMEAV
jgi:hypothetical protein